MLLYMYIAPGQGSPYDFKHILNDFIHVYSPKARTVNPLMSSESPYHFAHSLQV